MASRKQEKSKDILIQEHISLDRSNSQPSRSTTSVNEMPSTSGKRVHSDSIEQQHNTECKKAHRDRDTELRFRCSFCVERFPSLTSVRDHTRACHRLENERRKEGKLNSSNKVITLGNVTPVTESRGTNQNPESKHTNLFKCIACKFASISYNIMIEHCQNHVINYENPEITFLSATKRSVICGDEFYTDLDTYEECNNGMNYYYTFIECDYNNLKQDKWPGLYGNMPKSEIDEINCTSMYYFTRIIRLSSERTSSSVPYMIFQCQKCMKYVDPHSLVKHVQENSCSPNIPDFPCHVCKKPFVNETIMYLHYKMHKTADLLNMKFWTVTFNSRCDDVFNSLLLKAAGLNMQNLETPKTIQIINSQTFAQKTVNLQNKLSESNAQPKHITNDARSMIIPGTKTDARNKIIVQENTSATAIDKVPTVYKCTCKLCYHELEVLVNHLENRHSGYKSDKITCTCGLLFDKRQFKIHNQIHKLGIKKVNVKKISVSHEKIVDLCKIYDDIQELDHNELYGKVIVTLISAICNDLSLKKGKRFVKKEKLELNAAETTRTVATDTNDLIIAVLKTRGTMTVTGGNEDVNIKEAKETKSIGCGTDLTVMKSQETMTNPGTQNIVNSETKSVGTGTDELIVELVKSKEIMTNIKTQDIIRPVSETKPVGSEKDDTDLKTKENMNSQDTVRVTKDIDDTRRGSKAATDPPKDHLNETLFNPKEILTDRNKSFIENQLKLNTLPADLNNAYVDPNIRSYNKNENLPIASFTATVDAGRSDEIKSQVNSDTEITSINNKSNANPDHNKTNSDQINNTNVDKDVTVTVNDESNFGETSPDKTEAINSVELNAKHKTYTEEELLNDPDVPVYFDAEESALTDDEDVILLYEDDSGD